MSAPRTSNRFFLISLCVASVAVAYFAAKGFNYLLDPGMSLPANPSAVDVKPEDLAKLESREPAVAMALEKPEIPYFYVSAPLPEGTVVEFTLDADADHVVPVPEHVLRVLVTLHNGVGKTPRLAAPDHRPLPMGRYRVTVRHKEKNLVETVAFVGGAPTDEYRAAMTKHHAELRARAGREAEQLDKVAAQTEKHLKQHARGNPDRWQKLMREVRAGLDRTEKEHVPLFYGDAYLRLNSLLRDADGVEKEKDRIARLRTPDKERARIAGLATDVVLAELGKFRENVRLTRAEQKDPVKLFERGRFKRPEARFPE